MAIHISIARGGSLKRAETTMLTRIRAALGLNPGSHILDNRAEALEPLLKEKGSHSVYQETTLQDLQREEDPIYRGALLNLVASSDRASTFGHVSSIQWHTFEGTPSGGDEVEFTLSSRYHDYLMVRQMCLILHLPAEMKTMSIADLIDFTQVELHRLSSGGNTMDILETVKGYTLEHMAKLTSRHITRVTLEDGGQRVTTVR